MGDYNHAAAFVAFCRGTDIEEIALTFAIPITTLKNWVRTEAWSRLASDYQPAVTVPAIRAERDMDKIHANRQRNLAIALELQADLAELVTKLRDGTLTFSKATSTGLVVEMEPNLKDRVDLAAYAQRVADLGYRALGDAAAGGGEGGGVLPVGAASITIVLPAQVAAPRPDRSYDVDCEVIPLTTTTSVQLANSAG